MSAGSMLAAPWAVPPGVPETRSSFSPSKHLKSAVFVCACAGLWGPLHAASDMEAGLPTPAGDNRLVEDAEQSVDAVAHFDAAEAAVAPAPDQVSAADRLRGDPLQMAPVPPPEAGLESKTAAAPVKLTKDERAVALHITRHYGVDRGSIERIVHYAYKAAREVRLDPHLILAVMAVESRFDPNASSHAGAKGLMQVHVKVHSNRFEPFGGPQAVYDPPANIKVGAGILSEYVTRYGDVAAGLKAYVGAALLPSDRGYGSKVLNRQAEFKAVVQPEAAPAREARTDDAAEPANGQPAVTVSSKDNTSAFDPSSVESATAESM